MKIPSPMDATSDSTLRFSASWISERKFWLPWVVVAVWLTSVLASPAQTLTTLASFNGANGANPLYVTLVQERDGNLYGTTANGGAPGYGNFAAGTVFNVTPTGILTVFYSFCSENNCTDGEFPEAGLVQGTDGNFYGTTYEGGTTPGGTVFKITPTGTLTTLYSFCAQNNCADGLYPEAPLVQGTDGNFYGTTPDGGAHGFYGGTAFKITPSGVLTTLYSFCTQGGNNCTDGESPFGGLVQGRDGNFYGTTNNGGANGGGTIFKITPAGALTTLYSFCMLSGCADGANPNSLLQAADGNFYGTTTNGGGSNGGGTVFQFIPDGNGGTLNTLHSFCLQSGCPDGAASNAALVQATDGTFYGTTAGGGAHGNYGTIFQISPNGTGFATLYSFCGESGCADGEYPYGGLVQTSNGTLYGVTYEGGTYNDGTVYSLLPTSTNSVLTVSTSGTGMVTSNPAGISCPGTCSAMYPNGTPVTLNAMTQSGSTFAGWSGACTGTGPCMVTMTENLSVAATFTQPVSYTLTVSATGSGSVTSTDGNINCPGVCGYSYSSNTQVTLIAMPAQGWSFAGWSGACSGTGSCNIAMTQNQLVMAMFTQSQGNNTLTVSISGSGIVMSTDGFINCPGTCSHSYLSGTPVTLNATPTQGTMFTGWSLPCSGTGSCLVTMTQNLDVTASFSTTPQAVVLHSFGSGNDGQFPAANVISDSSGNLYGTTSFGGLYNQGRVFEVSPNGVETELYDFLGIGGDGQNPYAGLAFDASGNLYGTTANGGMYSYGTVFKLSPNGAETVLYNFGNGTDGQTPFGNIIFDSAGNLYGTTSAGGMHGKGTVFMLSAGGVETVLYSFNGGNDGQSPSAGLTFDNAGNLYGTTYTGGMYNQGTAFELSPNGGGWTETVLYNFGNGMDGAKPYAGVILDSSGNLEGTTVNGGAYGGGTAFELTPGLGGNWTETILYSFGNGSNDGVNPYAPLVLDSSGNFYGTTRNGGMYSAGTVFELMPSPTDNNHCCREVQRHDFGAGNDGQHPYAGLILDSSGNMLGTTSYGGAYGSGTVFNIMSGAVQFMATTPCRVVDTRGADGTFGGPAITGGTVRSFPLSQSGNPCNIPSNAVAYSLNVTVVPEHTLGYLTIWPTGQGQPLVSTLNSPDGRIKANAAIVPAGMPSGSVSVYVTDTTNVILDIDGYFTAPGSQTLQFYSLTPCRVIDTRGANGDLGGPYLQAQMERDFPVLESSCIPSGLNIAAYSMNFTVAPYPARQPLGYLTVWPQGQTQPTVSTLNNPTATVVANAAIVPAGTGGGIAVYPYNSTDLIVDINGYFAAPGNNGLSFYPLTPCRAYDSRNNNGQPFTGERTVNIVGSPCAPPSTAQAYVFNATVVPSGSLGYLTLWPDQNPQLPPPDVSTLNAYDGFITSNMAIVPNMDGSTDSYAGYGYTQLILDISGYFAP